MPESIPPLAEPNATPPATPPETPPVTPPETPPPAAASWTDGLNDEQKGLIEAKKFDNLGVFVDAYKSLDSMRGIPEDRILAKPEKSMEGDPEGWNKFYEKLGRPEKPEGYTVKMPEGQVADEQTVGWARETFHKLGLSKEQGEGLIQAWNALSAADVAAQTEKDQIEVENTEKTLRSTWGEKYDINKNLVSNTTKEFGLDQEAVVKIAGAIGLTEANLLFQKIGEKRAEAKFHDQGPKGSDVNTPNAAAYKIEQLGKDAEFMKKYKAGDVEAVEKMTRLTTQKFAGVNG
jgi:hypothetical protein